MGPGHMQDQVGPTEQGRGVSGAQVGQGQAQAPRGSCLKGLEGRGSP